MNILKRDMPEFFGKGLGQFKVENHIGDEKMSIEEGMFLAPKLYWVREKSDDGKKQYDKIVMKGIPQDSIHYVLEQKFDNDPKKLFNGLIKRSTGVYFDLLNGGDRIRMDFSFGVDVCNLDDFHRTLGGYQ